MEKSDISIKTGYGRFNYRVGAIILADNKLLMVKNTASPYYYSVGGRVKMNESSSDAVKREVFEETRIEMEIERLAYIHENFFIWEIKNEPFHEISFFYLMKPVDPPLLSALKCTTHGESGASEALYWLPVGKLSDYHLYPEFFKTELRLLKNTVGHFITKNGQTFCEK